VTESAATPAAPAAPAAPAPAPPTDFLTGLPALAQYVAFAVFGQALGVAAELRLAELLAGEPRTIDDLALATNTHAPSLARLVRALAAIDVVREAPEGGVELTPLGATLGTSIGGLMREAFGERIRRVRGDLLESVRTGEPAVDRLYGMSTFEAWGSDPEVLARVNEVFRSTAAQMGAAVVDVYDFSNASCIVDVGGNIGGLLSAILPAHPNLRGVLFDLPNVVAGAERVLTEAGVLDRCRIEAGDFFESVPAGGDVYVLQRIIHDWDDARAIAILRACRAAIRPDGVVLLVEVVLPERLESSPATRVKTFWDLQMLLLSQSGRERTEEEFRAVLGGAGFTLKRVIPFHPTFSLIEARPS
jgi:O-methyltransferase domain